MPLIPEKETDLNIGVEPKRPLFERLQEWIFRLDVGFGVQWFRLGLFCLLVLVVILLYNGTRFFGLRDRQAMDIGQLARNLARGEGYVTKFVRPVDIWYLNSIGRPSLEPGRNAIPELWMPPVYPWVVSVAFRGLNPEVDLTAVYRQLDLPGPQLPALDPPGVQKLMLLYDGARRVSVQLDRSLVLVAWLFFVTGLLLLYLVARDIFDHRVAVTSVILYLFCDPLLDDCISGLPTAFLSLLFLLTVYGVYKAEKWMEAGKSERWIYGGLTVSALAAGLGTLTQYSFAAVVLPLLVYVGVSFRKRNAALKVALVACVLAAVLAPWVARNWRVSRTMFGLARYELGEGVTLRYTEIKPGQLQRVFGVDRRLRINPIIKKLFLNARELYERTIKDVGSNYLIAFFLASLLHRFRRDEVFRLRRLLFWTLLMCLLWIGMAGPGERNPLTMFLPLIIIYGTAFFFVLFERLQFRRRWQRRGMVSLFVALNMLPFIFTLLPPARTVPYPPYDGGVIAAVGQVFRTEEVIATDIPWAVAWYADRAAIWAPLEREDFLAINDQIRPIAGVYVTQATPLSMTVTEAWAGHQMFWVRNFRPPTEWQPPDRQFPLQHWRPVTLDGMQVLLTKRLHWPVER